MKITRINIENILGAAQVGLTLPTPVTIFAGDNYTGKSSIREAIKLALIGRPERVLLKKEYHRLVHDAAEIGVAGVALEGGEAYFTAPDGNQELKHSYTMAQWEPMALALPYCLDIELFAVAKPDERRSLLFAITGASAKTADIVASLKKRGLDDKLVETVTPLLRSGFPAAAKFAEERCREAKGAWKGVTNETYGHVKADKWAAPVPEFDAAAIQHLTDKSEVLKGKIGTEQTKLGAAEQKLKSWMAHEENGTQDRATFARLASLEQKLEYDNDQLLKWQDQVKVLEQNAGTGPRVGLVHELARAVDYLAGHSVGIQSELATDGQREALAALDCYEAQYGAIGAEGDPEAANKLPSAIKSRDLMQNAVNNTQRDIDAAKAAGARLSTKVERGSEEEIAGIETILAGYQAEHGQVTTQLKGLLTAQAEAATADAYTSKAREHHQAAQQWQVAIDALSPDGIPAEILGKALDPLNQLLSKYSVIFGWDSVVIGTDMLITSGVRDYALQSESEKWRTDAVLALAIATISGLKLAAFDRFDVLGLAGRADFIDGIDVMAEEGAIDTALIFGTFKKLPDVSGFPQCTAFWVKEGTIAAHPDTVRRVA
ncbi:MAG: recombinase RecF [Burkholderiaceae bacterium]|nr:recombinase RecF [Burkholderiaceae bacterium]